MIAHSLLTHLAACADCRDALYLAMPEVDTQPVLRPSYRSPRLAVRWATLAASVVILGAVLLTNREMFYQHSPSAQPYSACASPENRGVEGACAGPACGYARSRDPSRREGPPAGQAHDGKTAGQHAI